MHPSRHESRAPIINFGGNIQFIPQHRHAPSTEAEVLQLLDEHADGKVRVVGALHSWSPGVVTDGAVIDLCHFNHVTVEQCPNGEVWATAGGGCRIKHLLREVHAKSEATLPSLGLITEQTIAGAIATGTHGSGKHSLSHYIDEIRIAAYDHQTGKARVYVWNEGTELQAARCSLGCLGIILSVRFRCVPKYDVAETITPCAAIDEVLQLERKSPLQQFFLIPHRWSYFVQQRQAVTPAVPPTRSLAARLYRAYWFIWLDIGFHLVLKLLASVLRRPAAIRWFYRKALGLLVLQNRTVIDSSDRMLVMEHELFKHLEIEIFVPMAHVRHAAAFVREIITVFDDGAKTLDAEVRAALERIGMLETLLQQRGTFTHHYPITFRRVLPDDTLISMSSGSGEPYYAISFITYVEPREQFYALASFLANSMTALFDARLHWGKYFPLTYMATERVYPHLALFRQLCRKLDPRGVFRNEFTDRVLGFVKTNAAQNMTEGQSSVHMYSGVSPDSHCSADVRDKIS
jgi:FAD/FMN-containing dehydrogenase